ncbi:MAG: serine/threonine-protein phosphatase [Planctomycetes bacterium]|nr:serine/threonine-protein phosphatase [Planctomycetota bacterium]
MTSTGFPLGVDPEASVPCGPGLTLKSGDLLLLVTDGILEAESPANVSFGSRRTLDIVRAHQHQPARAIVEILHEAVQDFCEGQPQNDDITAVVIKIH